MHTPILIFTLFVYLCVARALRWRRYDALHAKYHAKLESKRLTPDEAQEVVQLSSMYDMPGLMAASLGFSIFKTIGIPSISKLIHDIGAHRHIPKQLTDVRTLADGSNWMLCPLSGPATKADSREIKDPRAALAIARTNWIHAKYKIANEDFLYGLGLMIFDPISWATRYGWRELSPLEKYATFVYWAEVGRKLNFRDIPESLEEFKEWMQVYEEQHMLPAETNQEVGRSLMDELLFGVPNIFGLRSFFEGIAVSMLDERVRGAVMLPEPPIYAGYLMSISLRVVAFTQRYLLLPRRKPSASIQVELPQSAPTMFSMTSTSEPWYKPRRGGLSGIVDQLSVWMGWSTGVPGTNYKEGGYRIQELGPKRYEKEGHEKVFKMAEELQGFPIAEVWK
ncbi:hypothetical protein FB45DRAFT_751411 [Roridomyces roridus]|uniref:ER-bound oxygenase mpaB/mpaB'/Rubber oxygenase catalytic domain-containing protein n=1 Tax=Roridomyces roridus TaxID=1738132 RepID=A0AAD7BLU3_9AGAR|nr:hypothetical protein FB45DRAFT_751411 [Roridomyces roridus]